MPTTRLRKINWASIARSVKKVDPKPPNPNCTIKGNIDKGTWDHLYHLPTCRHYNQIILDTDMGEQFFCSEKEAQAAGFTLAPDCLR